MASTKEIKTRMSSVRDTQKITNAMYLISSTKLQKAKKSLEHTRPYFNAIEKEIKRIFCLQTDLDSIYYYPEHTQELEEKPYGCLVITADKGLAGAYNLNVIKETNALLSKHHDIKLFVVGEYGRHYFKMHNIPIERSFLYTAQNPTINRARDISAEVLKRYHNGEFSKFFIIYTDAKNGVEINAKTFRLLPFHRSDFYNKDSDGEKQEFKFEFEPSLVEVLNNIVPSYVSGYIYSALIDSFCSEQEARMTAMDAANRNADKILSELKLEYNRVRQASITQEITEVSAGAKAQKLKR